MSSWQRVCGCELGRHRPWPWAGLWGSYSRIPWPWAARMLSGQIAVAISQMRTLRPGKAPATCLAAPGHTWCRGRARPVRPRQPSGFFCGCASPACGRGTGHRVLQLHFILPTGRCGGQGGACWALRSWPTSGCLCDLGQVAQPPCASATLLGCCEGDVCEGPAQPLVHQCLENKLLSLPKHQAQQGCLSPRTGLARGHPAARSPCRALQPAYPLCTQLWAAQAPQGSLPGQGPWGQHSPRSHRSLASCLYPAASENLPPWSAGPQGVLCPSLSPLTEMWVAWLWEPHGGPAGGLQAAEDTIRQEGNFAADAGEGLGLSYQAASWALGEAAGLETCGPRPKEQGGRRYPVLGDTAGQVPPC